MAKEVLLGLQISQETEPHDNYATETNCHSLNQW